MITVILDMTEAQFAVLERRVKDIRAWLDAGEHTREGRGDMYVANLCEETQRLSLVTHRDEEGTT